MNEIRSKFVYCTPYERGSEEWKNCLKSLQEIIEDNPECSINVLLECQKCGVIAEDVSIAVLKSSARILCDPCAISESLENEQTE